MNCGIAEAKSLEFELQMMGHGPTRLFGDPTRVTQILTNLLSNRYRPMLSLAILAACVLLLTRLVLLRAPSCLQLQIHQDRCGAADAAQRDGGLRAAAAAAAEAGAPLGSKHTR